MTVLDFLKEIFTNIFGSKRWLLLPLLILVFTISPAEEVTAQQLKSIEVTTQPKLIYDSGGSLDLSGMEVTETYSDGSTKIVTFGDITWTSDYGAVPPDGTTLDESNDGTTVTVTHTDSGETADTDLLTVITVVDSIKVTTQPDKLTYDSGGSLDLSGMEVTETYTDGSTHVLTFGDSKWLDDYAAVPSNGTILDEEDHGLAVTVTNTNTGETADADVLTVITVVDSIEVTSQPNTLTYSSGELLVLSGLEVRIDWTDGTSDKNISYADFVSYGLTANPDEGDTLDESNDGTAVTVTHTDSGETADTDLLTVITVVDSIKVTTQPTLTYTLPADLDLSGMEVTETYTDGTKETATFTDGTHADYTTDPPDGTELAVEDHGTTVVVTHTDSGETAPTNTLDVADATVENIEVTSQPTTLTYNSGDPLDLSGLEVKIDWTDDTFNKNVSYADFESHGLTANPDEGDTLVESNDGTPVTVTHTDSGETADTDPLTVNTVLESIEVTSQPDKLTYDSGGPLELSGMVVTETYTDGDTETTKYSSEDWNGDYAAVPSNGTTLDEGDHGITVVVTHTDSGETAPTNTLTVITVVDSIEVTSQPNTLTYNSGESLDLSGLEARIDWTDGTSIENISYDDFVSRDLAANPDEGDILDETNDGTPVTVTHEDSGETAETETLNVNTVAWVESVEELRRALANEGIEVVKVTVDIGGDITVDRNDLTILGVDGPKVTGTMTVKGNNTTVTGFNFEVGVGETGIIVESTGTTIKDNEFRGSSGDAIVVGGSDTTIEDSYFADLDTAITIKSNVSGTEIVTSELVNNGVGILLEDGAGEDNSVHESNFENNDVAVKNNSETLFDATHNWWGHESGPYHKERNPFGLGDKIEGNIDFEPWYEDEGRDTLQNPEELEVRFGPNPVNPNQKQAYLHYHLPSGVTSGTFKVFNAAGREVFTASLSSGASPYEWDVVSKTSKPLANGIYLYIVKAGEQRTDIGKIMVEHR